MPTSRTPLTILTGFLGAGKTTLLNRILNSDHGLRLAVLVNDFGAVNIDAELVTATSIDGDTVSLSNGCICCTIRGDLLTAMVNLFQTDTPPEYILLETSGVSDPLEVALTFRDVPQMAELITIDSIVSLIDADGFDRLEREHTVLAMNQVGMADIVVLNKVDLVTSEQIETLRRTIHRIMPTVRVYPTTHANIPLELLLGVGTFDPMRLETREPANVHVHRGDNDHHHDHDHSDHSTVFETWHWKSSEPLDVTLVDRELARLPSSVYRMKGFLYLHQQPTVKHLLQVVGTRVTITAEGEWGEMPPQTRVVGIAQAGTLDGDALHAQLERCLYHPNVFVSLGQKLRGWLS